MKKTGKLLTLAAAVMMASCALADIATRLDSVNAVGFLQLTVAAGGSNTIVSVPFERCLGGGAAGMLADLVATNGLTSHATNPANADQLVVLTTNVAGEVIYHYFWYKTGLGWQTNRTERLGGGAPGSYYSPAPATNYPLARGQAFWLKRASADSPVNLFLKGQIASVGQPVQVLGGTNFTLIGLGALTPTNLNQVAAANWGSRHDGPSRFRNDADNLLVITNANGSYVTYYYSTNVVPNRWVDDKGNDPTVVIQPGTGFWYLRRGASPMQFTPVISQ